MNVLRTNETESLCPVCLKRIKATRVFQNGDVFMIKKCEDHGFFRTIIWRGNPAMEEWQRTKDPVHPHLTYGTIDQGCPFDCGLCEAHTQLPALFCSRLRTAATSNAQSVLPIPDMVRWKIYPWRRSGGCLSEP